MFDFLSRKKESPGKRLVYRIDAICNAFESYRIRENTLLLIGTEQYGDVFMELGDERPVFFVLFPLTMRPG